MSFNKDSRLYEKLKEVFGFSQFREHQELAVKSIIDNRDILMLLPTGGGKSLCYQLPALIREGVTIVVSPLLALMYDQVSALKVMGIKAESLSSMQNEEEVHSIKRALIAQKIKLLYVSPERMAAKGFIDFLLQLNISAFVIDEAHCISEWGHEFRDDYRKLSTIRTYFPSIPIAAFTATATYKVKSDIIHQLHLNDPVFIKATAFRKNIEILIKNREGNGHKQLLSIIEEKKGESGIVYAFSRKETEEIARFLRSKGIITRFYHAGMNSVERTAVHKEFMNDSLQVVVATIAFGMGIDKSNIRFVIHTSIPKSIENYYQEIGRAGRDGLDSQAVLLYSMSDVVMRKSLIGKGDGNSDIKRMALQQLQDCIQFVCSDVCRHRRIASYFGDTIEDCHDKCDHCEDIDSIHYVDISVQGQKFLSAVMRTSQSFGTHYLIDILRGSSSEKIMANKHHVLSVYGIGKVNSKQEWLTIANRLVETDALFQEDFGILKITKRGIALLKGEQTISIKETTLYPYKGVKIQSTTNKEIRSSEFDALRGLRYKIAREEKIPAYVIFSDKVLLEISLKLPKNRDEMLNISGMGSVKYEKYGEQFLNACRELS